MLLPTAGLSQAGRVGTIEMSIRTGVFTKKTKFHGDGLFGRLEHDRMALNHPPVIASEAKQSISPLAGMDCFVAALLAMTSNRQPEPIML